VYIVGAAEAPLGIVTDQTEESMIALAAKEALDEAGMSLSDVDAIFCNSTNFTPPFEGTVQLGEYLGIVPRYADSSDLGGAAFEAYVHHAMLAIATGRCEVALIAYASRQRSRRNRPRSLAVDTYSLTAQFESAFGLPVPIGEFALVAARHMHEFGTTPEQLASVAVTAREWAKLNPKAYRREPLTVADVLASPMMSTPFHKLDCCLLLDGGGAVIVTNKARASGAKKKPVRVLGAGESHTHWQMSQMPDMTRTAAVGSGRDAFAMAGITPADVDVFEPYDAFTITPILALEDLGFCAKGEGGAFFEAGHCLPGGKFPAITSGGGLSYNHPGAFGLLLLIEGVRQVRGEAEGRQVPDAEIGVVHGWGGMFSVGATVVLARE
jgi:acetyl-CoA acetyltransferase